MTYGGGSNLAVFFLQKILNKCANSKKSRNIRFQIQKFAEYSLYSLDKSEFLVYNDSNNIMRRNRYEIRNRKY